MLHLPLKLCHHSALNDIECSKLYVDGLDGDLTVPIIIITIIIIMIIIT